MKKYLSFFRLRFAMGLQYRAAALAGIITQFSWGFLEIMVYLAFYRTDAVAFPMDFSAMVSYIWLKEAFIAFFSAGLMENEIFDSIVSGNIAYELCRPIDLYTMWFFRGMANRLSKAVLRCFPILLVASFLPQPYGILAPKSMNHFLLFILTLLLGLAVMASFCMLIYVLTFFTISPQGLRILFVSSVELFSGAIIPLPFLPDGIRKIIELLPFASMQNVPLRIYSGSMESFAMQKAIFLQVFWLIVIVLVGKLLGKVAIKRVSVQGG